MIPIADENPLRHKPWLTIGIIALCTLIYLIVQPAGKNTFQVRDPRVAYNDLQFSLDWATVPCEITHGRSLTQSEFDATFNTEYPDGSACGLDEKNGIVTQQINPDKPVYLGLIFSMFLHGGLAHLFGNMLFLWVFGNNIEDSRGALRYLALYLIGGVLSDFAHIVVDPNSTVPVVGASGAIAAVMGAYLALYPKTRIKVITPWMGLRKISASWVLGLWVASQFLIMQGHSGVAWGAHLGGFAVGFLWGMLWRAHDKRTHAKQTSPSTSTAAPPGSGAPGGPPAFGAQINPSAVNPSAVNPSSVNPSSWQGP
jgi:membrane associated rhomboid family serine protease